MTDAKIVIVLPSHRMMKKHQTTYRIKADDLLGIHIDETSVAELRFVFWRAPWFYQNMRLNSENIRLKLNSIRMVSNVWSPAPASRDW